jgi:hypothetical protein
MTGFLFSRLLLPWNYWLVGLVASTVWLVASFWGGLEGSWIIENGKTGTTSWQGYSLVVLNLAVICATDAKWQSLTKGQEEYSLFVPVWLLGLCSLRGYALTPDLAASALGFSAFYGLWLLHTVEGHKNYVLAAGMAVGIGCLYFWPWWMLTVFAGSALLVWHDKALKRILLLGLGFVLPLYYRTAADFWQAREPIWTKGWNSPQAWYPEVWGQGIAHSWLPLVGLSAVGVVLHAFRAGLVGRVPRQWQGQWVLFALCLPGLWLVWQGEPLLLLYLTLPVWAMWTSRTLHWLHQGWAQDLALLAWVVWIVLDLTY